MTVSVATIVGGETNGEKDNGATTARRCRGPVSGAGIPALRRTVCIVVLSCAIESIPYSQQVGVVRIFTGIAEQTVAGVAYGRALSEIRAKTPQHLPPPW
ncbi:conserved protein of unknown function [Limnospira indica PCC 8005]|uniref:Uncharacterized protein n=1 Tax=Limnospira indica PCC 8005 TaxID=376219 RepID=A0A9P1KIB6_9CYAN|nr:conserved protein of unknown function [Limnospira indica PCC 8005]